MTVALNSIQKMIDRYIAGGNCQGHEIEIVNYFGKYFLYVTGKIYACFPQRLLFYAPCNWDNSGAITACSIVGTELSLKDASEGFSVFELVLHSPTETVEEFLEFSNRLAENCPEYGRTDSLEHLVLFIIASEIKQFVDEELLDEEDDDFVITN